jgi:nucleotidyltransferase/DNA polymerase involved in DNA repair
MRLLFLAWPHLPLRIERKPGSEHPASGELVVLGGRPWDAGTVLDCTPAARARGVRRGMSLGAAHKLVPEAVFLVPDPLAYRAAAEAALDALAAFTPFVEGEVDPTSAAFGQAFLGIEGLERLWGSEPALLDRIVRALAPILPGPPRAGIGGSRFAAQVAAVMAREQLAARGVGAWFAVPLGGPEGEAVFLAPLPITLLPAGPETQERLRVFGLRRIGELARLARSAVVARFGAEGGFLHDLANGRDGRPLVPRRPPERVRAGVELEPPVVLIEPLRFVLHRLAGALCEQLAARGAGAAVASLELALEGGEKLTVRQPLPAPTSQPEPIERLLLSRLELEPPPRPVAGMTLELERIGPAVAHQLGLFVPQSARAARLEWQVADLLARFGEGRILRAGLRDPDARLVEERIDWLPAGARNSGEGSSSGEGWSSGAPSSGAPSSNWSPKDRAR